MNRFAYVKEQYRLSDAAKNSIKIRKSSSELICSSSKNKKNSGEIIPSNNLSMAPGRVFNMEELSKKIDSYWM